MPVSRFLKVTLGIDVVLVLLALLVSFLVATGDMTVGIGVGGALGTLNLLGLAWLCGRLVRGEGAKWPWALGLALKFMLLIALVFVAVVYLPMDVIGFVVGISASGVAMVFGTSWLAVRKVEVTP